MFGIIRPCRHRMSEGLAASWLAHLCGLCLALRDGHGQFARAATNYDGLIVSVLVEAQTDPADGGRGRRKAGPCPLRGMRTAPVAMGEGARLAAAVSLVLASAKMRDHIEDADGAFGRRPVAAAARTVARRWDRAGARTGDGLGFDTAVLLDAVGRQGAIEAAAGPGTPLLTITEPTETATAAAFGHTAVLTGRPANRAPLEEAGRLFGRLAHLLDAVEDLAADTRAGAWNPLTATGTDLIEARRLCDDALHGIRLALGDTDFGGSGHGPGSGSRPGGGSGSGHGSGSRGASGSRSGSGAGAGRLAHVLLVHELGRSVDRAFGSGGCAHHGVAQASAPPPPGGNPYAPGAPGSPGQSPYGPGGPGFPGGFPPPEPPRRRGLLMGCLVYTGMCCTCELCCREHEDAWNGRRRDSWCSNCDCDGCTDCCDCCDCCDCGCDC